MTVFVSLWAICSLVAAGLSEAEAVDKKLPLRDRLLSLVGSVILGPFALGLMIRGGK